MDENQYQTFLNNHNIIIPDELLDIGISDIFKYELDILDNDLAINYSIIANFHNELSKAIKSYIQYNPAEKITRDTTSLKYSTLYSWNKVIYGKI